jgi:hypothetical protein
MNAHYLPGCQGPCPHQPQYIPPDATFPTPSLTTTSALEQGPVILEALMPVSEPPAWPTHSPVGGLLI